MVSSENEAVSTPATVYNCCSPTRWVSRKGDQSALKQVAGFAAQFGHIRHDPQGSQVEQGFGVIAHPGTGEEFFGEFVSHPAAGQRVKRMLRWQQARVDDRIGVRQNFGQFVVVGDDHIHAVGFGPGGLGDGADAGIAGDQQFDTLFRQLLEGIQMNAVRFSLTQGNVMADRAFKLRRAETRMVVEVWPSTSKSPQTQISSPS